MTIVETLSRISDWLNDNVCTEAKFKVPAEDRQPMDDNYEYKEVHPHAFPVFLPTKDKLPPKIISNHPSICVQVLSGADDLTRESRELTINLGFSVWNPGIHSKDIYYPKGMLPIEPEAYKSGMDGWMDIWNFIDLSLRKIESTEGMNGVRIARNASISFGPYKEQEAIPDYYPFWYAFIQFNVESGIKRFNEDIEKFL